jgi:hypothetical protein
MAHLAPIIRAAHERWDGTGYPDGLAGEAIPQAARIVFATDALCAISSRRPHRPARSTTDARDELRRGAGSQFDPAVVAALLAALDDADRRAGSTRRVSTAVLVVLVTALAGGATQSAAAARTHRCGDIPFRSPTQRSVAPGVTDVRAMRLDCTHARLLAAASKGCTSCDYHEGRFHCVPGRRRAGPPVSYPYHCTRRHARVTFTRWV